MEGASMEVVQVIDGDPPSDSVLSPTMILQCVNPSNAVAFKQRVKDWLKSASELPSLSAGQELLISIWLEKLTRQLEGEVRGAEDWKARWDHSIEAWQQEELRLAADVKWESQVSMGMIDGSAEDDHLLIRGNADNPGPRVARRWLAALEEKEESRCFQDLSGSGRDLLAKKLVDPQNPLTARVIANRVWHHLMGRGIVPTTDDFGVLGQRPSHQELLDHLAAEMVEGGWSIKELIREVVISSTYRQSSRIPTREGDVDADNVWLSHARVRRLEAESVRDSMLSVAGRLDMALEGRSVAVHLTDFLQGRGRPGESGPADGRGRRSLYTAVRRNFLVPMMTTFDAPVPFSAMGRRNVSNVPAQSLMLLNDPLVHDLARSWAENVLKTPLSNDDERIERMFEMAFNRRPTESEKQIVTSFIESERLGGVTDLLAVYQQIAHMMFNSKEFIFRF